MDIPAYSRLFAYAQGAYFADSHSYEIAYTHQTALDIYLTIAKQTPAWVAALMELRNRIVAVFGIKHVGRFQDAAAINLAKNITCGEKLGIFTLLSNQEHEIVLEDRDKHLDVRVSFLLDVKGSTAIVHASTVVHVHNLLGKLYMFLVTPIHKLIVPRSLKTLAKAQA